MTSKEWDDLSKKEKQRVNEIWKRELELETVISKASTELTKLQEEKKKKFLRANR